MGNGNTLPGAENSTTASIRAPTQLVEDFDANLERLGYENRSAAVRDFFARELEKIGVSPDGYFPARDDERRLYEALLAVANEKLIVNPKRSRSEVANRADRNKDELDAMLFTLRRKGYVRQLVGVPGTGEVAYRVKPPGADPEQWVYREVVTA